MKEQCDFCKICKILGCHYVMDILYFLLPYLRIVFMILYVLT